MGEGERTGKRVGASYGGPGGPLRPTACAVPTVGPTVCADRVNGPSAGYGSLEPRLRSLRPRQRGVEAAAGQHGVSGSRAWERPRIRG